MYAKHKKQLRPRLDRRNALKNVDYDASQSSASSVDDQPTHRTRSLDLYPLTDRTSFRIDGIDGEFDVICRSLGLSGPEDFAIPAAAWEARRPSSHSDRFADNRRNSDSRLLIANELSDSFGNSAWSDVEDEFNCRLNSSPENVIEVSDSVRNGVRVTDGGELRQGLNSSPENGFKVRASEQEDENFPVDVKRGIRGARPPMLAPPPASEVDNFTSAWEFIKGFGPADDKDTGSPLHDESPSSDLHGNELVGEIVTSDEESNEDFVRSGSQVSEPSFSKSETTEGVRGADDEVPESSSKSPSDDSYSLISKTSSKSPSGVSISDASNLSSKLMSDESYTLNLKVVNSVSPSDSATIKSWQKGDFLGSGSFGTVYEGFTDNGFFFAVKEVSLFDPGNQQSLYQLEQEISLLSQFRHKNIVRYHGTDKDEKNLYIFLELVTKGSLASVYRKYRLRDSHVSDYTRQILSGLRYLHSRNVIHRDIKCANILLDVSGSVKLADFGLAKATKLNDIKSCKGTAFWMAPEVVNRRNNGYGLPADIWSLGCTVLEMLTGQIPYSHLEGMQALFRIGKGEPPPMPDSLSGEAQDFISKCLQVNPRDRPTAAELLEHPFVKKRLPNYSSPAAP